MSGASKRGPQSGAGDRLDAWATTAAWVLGAVLGCGLIAVFGAGFLLGRLVGHGS